MSKADKVPVCVVNLKLGASLTGPTKRMLRDIREIALQCNAIRRRAEAWVMDTAERSLDTICEQYGTMPLDDIVVLLTWPEDIRLAEHKLNPPRKPPKPMSQEDKAKLTKKVSDLKRQLAAVQSRAVIGMATGLSNTVSTNRGIESGKIRRLSLREQIILSVPLYLIVRLDRVYKPALVTAFPGVSSAIVSACCQDVIQKLNSKMPRRFDQPKPRANKVWQGILLAEAQRDSWRSLRVPIMTSVSKLRQQGNRGHYSLDFPLFSKESRRENTHVKSLLHVRSHGERCLIRKIVANSNLFRDSEIVYDTDNEIWQLKLVCSSPNVPDKHAENVAELLLASPMKQQYPFVILRDDWRPWWIGRGGKFVRYAEDYLWRKRKVVGLRYSDSQRDQQPGHGRGSVYRKTKPQHRSVSDRRKQFVRDLIFDVVTYCKRNGIGKLIYWEPSQPLRNGTWFSRNGISFNWSTFTPRLVARLEADGVDVDVKTERLQIHYERWGVDSKAVFARVSEQIGNTEVASAVYIYGEGKASHQAAPLASGTAMRSEVSGYDVGDEADVQKPG